jgi:uncharacterized cupin superfamily protein
MIFNVLSDDWDERRSNPGYAWERTGVGRRLGGELLGASLYQLCPGQRSWPYHAHYGNEELLVVLDGRPTLRTPDGERELRAGDTTIFPRGPEGGHQVINGTDRPARFLMVSTMVHPRSLTTRTATRSASSPAHRPSQVRTRRSSSYSAEATQPTTATSSTHALDDDPRRRATAPASRCKRDVRRGPRPALKTAGARPEQASHGRQRRRPQ